MRPLDTSKYGAPFGAGAPRFTFTCDDQVSASLAALNADLQAMAERMRDNRRAAERGCRHCGNPDPGACCRYCGVTQ